MAGRRRGGRSQPCAVRVQRAASARPNTWARDWTRGDTQCGRFQAFIGSKSSRIWARSHCKICSPHWALSFACGSWGVFRSVPGVVTSPTWVCLAASYRGNPMPRSCQPAWVCLQTSLGCSRGPLAPLCYLGKVNLSSRTWCTRMIFVRGLDFGNLKSWFFYVPTWVACLRILQDSFAQTFWLYFVSYLVYYNFVNWSKSW
jgi:hypothetical protein